MDKTKCIEYRGVRDVVCAEVITDTADKFEVGTPFSMIWASEISKDTATSTDTHYYDNMPAIGITSTGPDTITISGSALADDVYAKITGQYYDEETGMLVEGKRKDKNYAIGYITEDTSGEERYVWRLKGSFGIPSATHKTKDDGTEANGQQVTYTGVSTIHKFKKTGETAKAVQLPASKYTPGEAKFFETVQTPDTIATALAVPATQKDDNAVSK